MTNLVDLVPHVVVVVFPPSGPRQRLLLMFLYGELRLERLLALEKERTSNKSFSRGIVVGILLRRGL